MPDIIDIDTLFGPMPAAAADLAVDELASLMRRHGVQACCTLSTVGMLLDHTAGNSATRAACAEQPALVPVATLNPQTWLGTEGVVERFADDGFKMVRLFPGVQGWEPDYAPCVELARRIDAAGRLPLMVDVDQPGHATRFVSALRSHAGPLVLGGVRNETLSEAVALLRGRENLFVVTAGLVALGAVNALVDAVGADRLLYGSGAPSRPMASALGVLRFAGLAEADRDRILAGNARQLLGP